MDNKLIELLRIESSEMNNIFKKASVEGEGTPQEISDRREKAVQDLFERYFPFPFRVVKGNIIDLNGLSSCSIDCVIINPSHPYTIDKVSERPSIIFADATDFAIEIKSDLSQKNEVERALDQIASVKRLTRNDGTQIKGIIFANSTYAEINTLMDNIVGYHIRRNIDFRNQFDIIFINNRGILLNYTKESGLKIGRDNSYGLYYFEAGEDSLAYLIKLMNTSPLSEMRMRESILVPYLKKYLKGDFKVKKYCEYVDGNYYIIKQVEQIKQTCISGG